MIKGQISIFDDELLQVLLDTSLKRVEFKFKTINLTPKWKEIQVLMQSKIPSIDAAYINVGESVFLHFGTKGVHFNIEGLRRWETESYIKDFSNLKILSFQKVGSGSQVPLEVFINMLKGWPQLKTLKLPDHDLTIEYLIEIGKYSSQLEEIDLSKNTGISMSALIDMITKCPELKYLDLTDCTQFSDSDIQHLFSTSRPFEDLYLENLEISVGTLKKINLACPLLRNIRLPKLMGNLAEMFE